MASPIHPGHVDPKYLENVAKLVPVHFTNYELAEKILLISRTEKEAASAGFLTQEELRRWRAGLEDAAKQDHFFASVSGVLIVGTKSNY